MELSEGSACSTPPLRSRRPGTYQLQAAIVACHAAATDAATTDWAQVAALYGQPAMLVLSADPTAGGEHGLTPDHSWSPDPALITGCRGFRLARRSARHSFVGWVNRTGHVTKRRAGMLLRDKNAVVHGAGGAERAGMTLEQAPEASPEDPGVLLQRSPSLETVVNISCGAVVDV
ncbi:hypothetical protein ACFYXH_13115 [Streptomyces sp. NPDC002730]|uniref:hypothetical protein n=1 Tax=Streptomyces sp. NPDC002730 TaxID=3364662 RepID=UPI0036957DDD